MKLDPSLKVLVTGANGQLGHQLVQKLTGKVNLLALEKATLDISQSIQVDTIVNSFSPDVIINAAAYTAVDKAEQEPLKANAVNHLGAKYLACAAEKNDAVLIHVSTDYVFSGNSFTPYLESDPTSPLNVYGETKLKGEQVVLANCTKAIILRTSWVFGEYGNNFVKTMFQLAKKRDEFKVVDDQIGGPTYSGDIAGAIITICRSVSKNTPVKWGTYHYSGKPYVSWYEFTGKIYAYARKYKRLEKNPSVQPVSTAEYPTAAERPRYSKLDCRKIKKEFGIDESDWQLALNKIFGK